MNNRSFDVVIVGSGLGGLLCGAFLSKFNKQVCVLEKHHQIGGNLQTFVRKGIKFNSAMHYIGGLDEGQILHQVFSYLDIIEKIGIEKLDSSCYEKVFLGDKEYCNCNGVDAYKDRLLSYFPEEEEAIEAYIQKIQEIWTRINILNLKSVYEDSDQEIQYSFQNAYEFICSITENEELRSLLSISNSLYAGIPEKSSLLTHAIISYHYMQSAYMFSEGSDKLALALEQVIVSSGGVVRTNKTAVKFHFDGKNACAVELNEGGIVNGKSFISDIHPAQTIKLVEPGRFRKAYVNRIKGLQNTIGSFCVYIALKKNAFKSINSNVYISTTNEVWIAACYDQIEWPSSCVLYTKPDKDNPEYAESMVVVSFMKYEEVKQWEMTGIEKRGAEYNAFKTEKAEALLNLLETKYPNIISSIGEYYTATPLTFRDYTNNPEGSMYGIYRDCNDPRSSYISSNTRIPNLYLTGQNSGGGLHGVLGVTVSALYTCANIIDLNTLLNTIRDEGSMG